MDIDLNHEIEKLFPALEIALPSQQLLEFNKSPSDEIQLFHFGLGLYMRNSLLLSGSKLINNFIRAGIHNKDDMSLITLRLFYEYLKQK